MRMFRPGLQRLITNAFLFVFLAAVLLPVPSMADNGGLTASSLRGSGAVTAEGSLAVLLQENTDPDHEFGYPDFRLDAKQLVVETDHAEAMTMVGTSFVLDPQTTTHRYTDARVEGVQHREDYRFSLWPLGGTTITQENDVCLEATPSQLAQVAQDPLLRFSRDTNSTRTSDALQWTGCGDSRATVQGDFLLRLWEWDAELFDGENRESLPSGTRNAEGTPSDPDLSGYAGQGTEQFLYAYNATLTIPRLGGQHLVYVQNGQLAATGGMLLREATGSLELANTVLAVDRQRVFVQGDLTMRTQAVGLDQPFSIMIDGQPNHLEIDGQNVPLATEAPAWNGSGSSTSWVLPVAGAFMAVMAVLWVSPFLFVGKKGPRGFKQRRAEGFHRMAVKAEFRGQVSLARFFSGRAVRWEPHNPTHWIDKAYYHASKGQTKKALECHEKAHKLINYRSGDYGIIAQNAYEAAKTASKIDEKVALSWLTIAIEHDPATEDLAAQEPALKLILADMRKKAWKGLVGP